MGKEDYERGFLDACNLIERSLLEEFEDDEAIKDRIVRRIAEIRVALLEKRIDRLKWLLGLP